MHKFLATTLFAGVMIRLLTGGGASTADPAAASTQSTNQAAPPAVATEPAKAVDPIQITVGQEGLSVFAVAVDAHALFVRLAQETGLRLVVDDTVDRTITVNLVNQKVTEALNNIVSAYGLSCREINGIYMISEGIPKTPSSYLLSDIDAISTQYVLAPNAKSLLPIFLQDHVKTNQEQNSVILSAPPDVLKKFRQDIAQFDIPASQIMIEVLMVEFTDSAANQFALNWAWSNENNGANVDTPFGEIFFRTITALPDQFSANLRALVTKGKARIRANPRVATVSGQTASIFIGKQRYLSTPVVVSSGSGDEYGMTQKNSIDAGVNLSMTPWTGGEGEIIVDIHPEISVLSAPDATTGLPDKSTRRANTTVHVRDGETVIIGGLVQHETIKTRTKIPLLGDIPLLGQLFRTQDDKDSATELVIFITPHILTQTGHLPPDQEKKLKERFLDDAPPKKSR